MKIFNSFIVLSIFSIINLSLIKAENNIWRPKAGTTWNWSLGQNPNNLPLKENEYEVIDIDLYDVKKETITSMHNLGLKVICYFSAGTYETFRDENKDMVKVEGLVRTKMKDWDDEYWLDVRVEGIKPFMLNALNLAKEKNCDGVEFDNVDAYTNVKWEDTLTKNDQITYNRWLAEEAHQLELAAGLKNCVGILSELVDDFDFAINEQCSDYNECINYDVFLDKDMAVFTALYGLETNSKFMNKVCSAVGRLNLSVIIKDPSQDLKYPYTRFVYDDFCEDSSTEQKKTTTTRSTSTKSSSKTTTTTKSTTTKSTKKSTTKTTKSTSSKTTSTTTTALKQTSSTGTRTIKTRNIATKTKRIRTTETKKRRSYRYREY